MMEVGWSTRRVACQLGRSDCVPIASSAAIQAQVAPSLRAPEKVEGHLQLWHPLRVLPLTPDHRRLHLEWCYARGNRTAVEWNQVVFSDKSRFNLRHDDNRVRVWRPRGECLNPVFALQRHIAPTAGVMVRGAIVYNTRSPLLLIHGTMTAQQCVHNILQPNVLPLMQRLPGAIFQQDNAQSYTAKVSQGCLHTVTTLPWPNLSLIKHIQNHFRRRVGHPTSFNELGARLQQIWNKMSQDIIQNLYASMPDRIALSIHARGGSTGY
ncbi:transposable element Tcb2 transposase [Trichonephila clavipes]|nr:transposable element Tcb2 transposase [Trichonephila clavipes]